MVEEEVILWYIYIWYVCDNGSWGIEEEEV